LNQSLKKQQILLNFWQKQKYEILKILLIILVKLEIKYKLLN